MPWDIEDLNPVTRFYYGDEDQQIGDGDKSKEWVELRVAADEDTERMRKQAGIKQKVEYRNVRGRAQRLEFLDSNEQKINTFSDLLNDFTIVDWYLFDKQGQEIPCTKENKLKLMKGSPMFAAWIASCTEQIRSEIENVAEEEAKNS